MLDSRDDCSLDERQYERTEGLSYSVNSYVLKSKSRQSMPLDSEDDCSLDESQQERSEKQSYYVNNDTLNSKSKSRQSMQLDSTDDCSLDERRQERSETLNFSVNSYVSKSKSRSSSTLNSEEKKKVSKKERYSKGIKAAVALIVEASEFSVLDKAISDGLIKAVLASMICGELVTSKSPKGEKALQKATQIDHDFVRIAINTCKKTRMLGGKREEMECASASVLACRGLRKYNKCKFDEAIIDKMSDFIARETMGMMKEENDSDDNDKNDNSSSSVADDLATETHVDKNRNTDMKTKQIINLEKQYVTNIAQTIDYCLNEDETSVEFSVKSISSVDTKLRETSLKVWNSNVIDNMSYGLAEALNICGSNLLSVSDDVKKDLRMNKLLRY